MGGLPTLSSVSQGTEFLGAGCIEVALGCHANNRNMIGGIAALNPSTPTWKPPGSFDILQPGTMLLSPTWAQWLAEVHVSHFVCLPRRWPKIEVREPRR